MKVAYKNEFDPNKKIYQCSVCGSLFQWSKQSSWYGSDKDAEENPERIKYFCSDKCKEQPKDYISTRDLNEIDEAREERK